MEDQIKQYWMLLRSRIIGLSLLFFFFLVLCSWGTNYFRYKDLETKGIKSKLKIINATYLWRRKFSVTYSFLLENNLEYKARKSISKKDLIDIGVENLSSAYPNAILGKHKSTTVIYNPKNPKIHFIVFEDLKNRLLIQMISCWIFATFAGLMIVTELKSIARRISINKELFTPNN